MPLVSIDLHEPVAAPLPQKVRGAPIVFTSTNLTRGSVPGRGLLYSFLVHEIALFSLISYYSYRIFTVPPSPPPEEFQMVDLREPSPVVYLPMVGGGSGGVAQALLPVPRKALADRRLAPRGPKLQAQARAPVPPARTTSGLTYPGPQPIVSDVPNPTNTFQTILQPELKHPPLIKSFVPLPNIVQMAQAAPPPAPDVPPIENRKSKIENRPEARVVVPVVHLEPERLPEAPHLKLPKTAPKNLPVMPSAKAPEPKPVVPVLPPIENLKSKIENPLEAPKLEVPTAPVHTLSASLMPSAKPPEPKPVVPKLPPIENLKSKIENPPEAPKLGLPTTAPVNLPVMPGARPPEKQTEAPAAPSLTSLMPTEGKDARNLLALSPLPAPAEESVKVPVGEARGRFAISPEPSQAGGKTQPGSKSEGVSSSAIGIGQAAGASGTPGNSQAGTGNALGLPARVGGEGIAGASSSTTGPGSVGASGVPPLGGSSTEGAAPGGASGKGGSGGGADSGLGTAAGRGTGTSMGAGTGTGVGTGGGTGIGTGPGTGSGSGSGAGTGNGGGAFPGISIQGGSLRGGIAAKPMVHRAASAPPRGSYSLTIVSTSSSGGGLADFGVFRNERVYTVYLDMRQTVEDPAPSWTLQYALLRGADAGAGAPGSPLTIQQGASPNGGGQGLVPPFPLAKEQPNLPLELAQKYQHRLVVVYAIINKEGKFEQVAVKQSPNAQLNGPVLEALGKWVFRPAEVNGETVPVKALLGIPIALPQ